MLSSAVLAQIWSKADQLCELKQHMATLLLVEVAKSITYAEEENTMPMSTNYRVFLQTQS